jgi:hypothetical protein
VAASEVASAAAIAPVAVVWCRQVDNEAESPGYTTIPEEFPGRRETLDAIRIIGNLTVNIADTHDYWDPDPAQPLSFYPNLFLYPAANGRYTCVGRMFLSTEDRPRLGMKTLVFSTADLLAGGEFGATVLRAHATMGPAGSSRPALEPDGAVYQAVGEGFLFHRGTTEPVVIVASDQWEAGCQVVLDLVRLLPGSLVALGAFLSFPYFLPEAKVNIHEFTEQVPLALAIMRVPRGEAQGERHTKRIQSWETAPVALRDLTRPATARDRGTLPLVLQYARDHLESKLAEVAGRVDLVEGPRTQTQLHDPDRQGGRDRRKEMWRMGTAMETAALLLSRPKGRSVPMSGETAKRANEYVQAQPSIPIPRPAEVLPSAPPAPSPSGGGSGPALPPWLQRPPDVHVPSSGPVAVPVSVSDDPSSHVAAAPPPGPLNAGPVPPSAPSASPATVPVSDAELESRTRRLIDQRLEEHDRSRPVVPPTAVDTKILAALDARLRDSTEKSAQAMLSLQADLGGRIAALEARPAVDPTLFAEQLDRKVSTRLDTALPELTEKIRQTVQSTGELWAERLRDELKQAIEELKARSVRGEEELRAALVAQLDLELAETKEQGTALREEVEGRVRDLLKERTAELEQRRTKEVRDLEQRLAILVDGRAKDLETRLTAAITEQRDKVLALADERIVQAEQRVEAEREARVLEVSEANTAAIAALQVRLQAFFEQKLHENQEREREKYVELLARLKSDVDQSLAKTIDSTRFDQAVRERVMRLLDGQRAEQEKLVAAGLADAELRLKAHQDEAVVRLERLETKLQQRETDLARVERNLRQETDDVDRRILVLSDRVLPLVRKTWLKVAELEKRGPATDDSEARFNELRRELVREMRRVEGELLEQTSDLRDRLEGTIAHQGRIWLNLLKQLSSETESVLKSGPQPARRPSRPASEAPEDEFLAAELRTPDPYASFADMPPNPMDPSPALGPEAAERDARRRATRRS